MPSYHLVVPNGEVCKASQEDVRSRRWLDRDKMARKPLTVMTYLSLAEQIPHWARDLC